ncbi:MAG TPA: hypothetical protein VNN25_26695 [Thermoanaerobaculia bacterium]|nr:hypothetical protein [Thermoanaerobaculia bacterium]
MVKYNVISDEWFYLLLPKGQPFDQFEAADGTQDREKTKTVLSQMAGELPRSFSEILHLSHFEYSVTLLGRVDEALTPDVIESWMEKSDIESWMEKSDPDDPNNFFKLTLSELAVYLGSLLIRHHGGEWHYSRFPNFFQSSVVINDIAFHVFDTLMKRCSEDHGHEKLLSKWSIFNDVLASSAVTPDKVS